MYKFIPILKTLVWGTEAWVLSGVMGNISQIAEGPLEGKTLNDIWQGEFPLLIKFIDAHQDLSIQVHPDDKLAQERHGCNGKTEMWYVIGATEDAHLLSGLSKPLEREEYGAKVADGSITDYLASYKVNEGDVFFLPAGRIHAIGGGCHIAEIQQTSDITYRLYDYGRLGLDGKPRQLHTQEALDAIDFSVSEDYRTNYERKDGQEVLLVDCPYFKTSLLELDGRCECPVDGKFLIVVCMEGEAEIEGSTLHGGEAGLVLDSSNVAIEAKKAKLLIVRK